MSVFSRKSSRATIVPTLRYRDLEVATAWLREAFGFELRSAERDSDGRMASAQLVLGSATVMLARVGESAYDALLRQPDEIGGAETQSCYIVVADADAHYAIAKSHGAEMIFDLQTLDNGNVGYLCRDLEGHLWSFGTLNPAAADAESRLPSARTRVVLAAGLLTICAAAYTRWPVALTPPTDAASQSVAMHLVNERAARVAAETEANRARTELAQVQGEREALLRDVKQLHDQTSAAARRLHMAKISAALAKRQMSAAARRLHMAKISAAQAKRRLLAQSFRHRRIVSLSMQRERETREAKERDDKSQSDREAAVLRAQIEQERAARESAEASRAKELSDAIAKEQEGRTQFDRTVSELRSQLAQERAALLRAQQSSAEATDRLAEEMGARARAEADLREALAALQALEAQPAADQRSTKRPRSGAKPVSRRSNEPGRTASSVEPLPDFQP